MRDLIACELENGYDEEAVYSGGAGCVIPMLKASRDSVAGYLEGAVGKDVLGMCGLITFNVLLNGSLTDARKCARPTVNHSVIGIKGELGSQVAAVFVIQ